jgi:twitching motility protein PilT
MDFDKLLTTGVERGASDLHLKPHANPILRVHGHLETQDDLDVITPEFMDDVARRLLGERRHAALREGREMDFAHFVPGSGRFRVNMFLAKNEIRAVLRAIPTKIPRFEELHLPKVLEKLAMERRGMILVTGITGSGKSTTLAAMIDFMNRARNDHIVTIEDPIEFAHEDKKCVISQREIGHDSESFAIALRAALRQDPDIILVGEMRDAETMAVALHAAETGHLVLSTLHTLDATETVNRIISSFPPHQEEQIRDQLAAVIQGVVSQRLIVRADGKGRVPATEVMIGTGLIRDCIREAEKTPQIPAVMAAGTSQYGMQTFDQSLLALYRDEMITYEVARDAATNPDDFDLKVKGIFSAGEMTYESPRKPKDTVPGLTGNSTPAPSAPSSAPRQSGGSFFKRS